MPIENFYVKNTKDNIKINRTLFIFSKSYKSKDIYRANSYT